MTKKVGWCSQYSDYNIGWTSLIFISCEGQVIPFFSKHPVRFWGAPSLLFNESQQYSWWDVKLTTCLRIVPRLKMSGILLLLPLRDFMVCTGTTLQFLHMPNLQAIAQFDSTLCLNPRLVEKRKNCQSQHFISFKCQ